MTHFSKPEKGRTPPSGMPVRGDIGVRPGNIIIPSYREMYGADVTPFHRNFRVNEAAVEIAGGRAFRHLEYKASISGEIGDAEARGVTFRTDTPELCGFLVRTNSRYAITDSVFTAFGNGRNDFIGNGALLMTDDFAQAVVRGCSFETTGCVRPCTAAGLESVLKVYESKLKANGGEHPPGYVDTFQYGLEGGLGHIRGDEDNFTGMGGNSRPHMSLNNSRSYFYDCEVVSDGWAALSTDSVHGRLYLEANRCSMKVLHNGYSTWSDTGSTVVYNDCDVNCASLLYVITGEASITVNNCRSRSGRYGVNMQTNANDSSCCLGELSVNGGSFSTGRECVRVFSQNAYIQFNGVELHSDKGVLLHSMVNPRPRTAAVREDELVYGIKAVFSEMDMDGDILHEDPHRTMALTLISSSLRGRVCDAYISLLEGSHWFATGDSFVGIVGDAKLSQFDAPAGVTINAVGAGACTLCGEFSLPSGGKLVVA